MRLSVGCAMWTLKPWQGRFLPHPSTAGERLRAYAGWCDAVEGNTTFYATPSRETTEVWAAETPESFRFVLKLPKPVTHEHRLSAAAFAPLAQFLTAIEPLGPRVHALWIQLPGSFGPADVPTLSSFLRRLPAGYRYAVEVRHQGFFDDPVLLAAALAPFGVEWVPFDTTAFFAKRPTSDAEREAWTKKPRMPLRTEALTDLPIIRYLGRDDPGETAEGWRRWVDTAAIWLREGRSPTVFIHTPDNADAPELARRFHDEVRARVPALEPLPTPEPIGPPTLF
ncbi:uncharacterized protein YecE (DUF72 family) [Catenuloplanes nepalensis]|uniref:Uncharacterized protein YecE (DUF72 family) n=2 Tax=Catenuloplanes nepalensis TaxID=587533 RepID=A0ABT9MMH8_9ACTN|nr:uncharacterized protein YecE (DUF72 family) [Catenuloplanes nepalensis]